MRVAIVGGGIAGLGAARALAGAGAGDGAAAVDVELFEAERRAGGHAHTVDVHGVPVDAGFIVYNEPTYPLFTRLVAELGVATRPTEMSFSTRCARCGVEYGTAGADLVSPRHWRLFAEMLAFFRVARRALEAGVDPALTLDELLARHRVGPRAIAHFVKPMGAAIWSTDAGRLGAFPAATFLRFFTNHGMLALTGAPRWRTIVGGSRAYVDALLARLARRGVRVHREAPVARVHRDAAGVTLELAAGAARRFDAVVLATHSDQALALLADPGGDERALLGAIGYTPNEAWLHTDASFLPRRRASWAAWNYHVEDCAAPGPAVSVTYWMNRLQGLPGPTPYLVTLNPTRPIDPARVIRRIAWAHPRFDREALRAQARLGELQGRRRTWFAGAWQGYGFHEDGLRAGTAAAAAIKAAARARRAAEAAA